MKMQKTGMYLKNFKYTNMGPLISGKKAKILHLYVFRKSKNMAPQDLQKTQKSGTSGFF